MSERSGSGGVLPVVFIVLAAMGGLSLYLYNEFHPGVEHAHHRRSRCASNLKQIGYGVHLYSSDYDEEFPESLPALYEMDYLKDHKVYVCGNAADQVAPFTAGDPFTEDNVSYCYVSGVHPTDPPDYVVAFDEETNHDGDGVNVLYTSGSVQWLADLNRLHNQLARQEKELAAKGRTMTVLRPGWSMPPADGLSWR